jgi:lambda family phage portal protein
MNAFDKFTAAFAPRWTLNRVRARAALEAVRNFDAAQGGRRTENWKRNRSDANTVNALALTRLREHARDLLRNSGWSRRGVRTIVNNTVGWGIRPKPLGASNEKAMALWRAWADTTECESEGLHTFAGIQRLAMATIATSGEVLIRRRKRKATDGLTIPLQLQVLEPDYLDESKTLPKGDSGGPVVQGVEYDAIGRRAAYWLFDQHPGAAAQSLSVVPVSKRVPASEILHVYDVERAGQARGVSWLAAAIVTLRDLDEYEDAELMKQKIASCFAAFVTDLDGTGAGVGEKSTTDARVETLEPGLVANLPPGKQVTFGNPPTVTDSKFTERNLRKVAASLGVTYEDLTGDYSQVNFSSARMARLAHWANVYDWQWQMLIPRLCAPIWAWAMEAASIAGEIGGELPDANWVCPPMPMIEPDKEGLAIQRLVRSGAKTFSEAVREQGHDPDEFFAEYAADLKVLDGYGIKLDSDVRAVSQAGLTQERVGMGGGKPPQENP